MKSNYLLGDSCLLSPNPESIETLPIIKAASKSSGLPVKRICELLSKDDKVELMAGEITLPELEAFAKSILRRGDGTL